MRADPQPSPRTDTLTGLGALLGLWLSGLGLVGAADAALPAAIELGTNDTAAVTLSIPLPQTAEATPTFEAVSWLHPPVGVPQPPLDWRVVDEHMRVSFELAIEGLDGVPQRWSLEVVSDEDRWGVEALIDPSLSVVGPIARGQTLWSVASQWPAATGEATAQVTLRRWVAANPHAFIGDDPASLRQGALLVVPNQAYVDRARAPLTPPAGGAPDRDAPRPAPPPGWVVAWWALEGVTPPQTPATGETTAETMANTSADTSADTMAEPTQIETANTPGSVGLADDAGAIARLAWPVLSVMVGLMVLHGWAHRALGQPPPPARAVPVDAEIGPGSPELAWALAQWSARHHDRSQALHWLDEVIQHGSPKLARQAKRLVAQGAAGHETVDQKTGEQARREDRSIDPAGSGQARR